LLLKTGEAEGLEPCGLGARDTLRLEAAMPLYGHELSPSITPIEAGLKMFVKPDREGFIAREALMKEPLRRRIGLELIDRGIAREGSPVYFEGRQVGFVSSGTHSPTLNKAIAMALVEKDVFQNTDFSIDVRGRQLKARKIKLPFYKKPQGEKV
jgi:aminomethyltransferase